MRIERRLPCWQNGILRTVVASKIVQGRSDRVPSGRVAVIKLYLSRCFKGTSCVAMQTGSTSWWWHGKVLVKSSIRISQHDSTFRIITGRVFCCDVIHSRSSCAFAGDRWVKTEENKKLRDWNRLTGITDKPWRQQLSVCTMMIIMTRLMELSPLAESVHVVGVRLINSAR